MIAQHPANRTCLVVVVYDQRAGIAANDALSDLAFNGLKLLITKVVSKFTPANLIAVCRSTRSTPTVEAIVFLIVRREKFFRTRLLRFTTSTG